MSRVWLVACAPLDMCAVPCVVCCVCVSQSFTLSADTVTVSGTVNAAGEDGPTDHGGGGGGSIRIEASTCDVTGALLATGGDAHGTCDFSIVGAGVLHAIPAQRPHVCDC